VEGLWWREIVEDMDRDAVDGGIRNAMSRAGNNWRRELCDTQLCIERTALAALCGFIVT
jgi:hypothetical protein